AAGSERKSGAVGRRVSLRQGRQNALIRRDVTVPMGSGGRGSGRQSWSWKRQRAKSVEAADPGANRGRWWSEGPNGSWKRLARKRSDRPGALTLEWKP